MLSIQDIKALPKITAFRYDVKIWNSEGEEETLLQVLTTAAEETGDSVELNILLPAGITSAWMASLVASLPSISKIYIDHETDNGKIAYSTLHRITGFLGWKTKVSADSNSFLYLSASYSSEVSFPIAQSEEGIANWLKDMNKEDEK